MKIYQRVAAIFAEHIVASRWGVLVSYAVLAAFCFWVGVIAMTGDKIVWWSVAVNFAAFGWCVSNIMWTLQMPGMFRALSEANAHTMEVEFATMMDKAWLEFLERHPEAAEHMGPPQRMN